MDAAAVPLSRGTSRVFSGACSAPPSPIDISAPIDIAGSMPKAKRAGGRALFKLVGIAAAIGLAAGTGAVAAAAVASGIVTGLVLTGPPPPPACHFDGRKGCVPSNAATASCRFAPRFVALSELCEGIAG